MKKTMFSILVTCSLTNAQELNSSMQQYMVELKSQALQENSNFKDFDYQRGQKVFLSKHLGKNGQMISCATCHSTNLSANGKNINTNKTIKPLSPYANPTRFTDVKEVQKWLRRNFRDVYNRVGTAQEKGDVITYIINKQG